jgi:hypothetical protein
LTQPDGRRLHDASRSGMPRSDVVDGERLRRQEAVKALSRAVIESGPRTIFTETYAPVFCGVLPRQAKDG